MKKFLFISALFVYSLATSSSFASDNFIRCPINPKPKVLFHSSLGKLKYDFTKSTEELTAMRGKGIWGLALRKLGSYTHIEYKISKYGQDYCIYPELIEVYIGVGNPKIYVTNELEEGSCDYLYVLRHEQAHIQTTIRLVEHFVKTAPYILDVATREIRPIYVKREAGQSGIDAAGKQIYQEYKDIVEKMQNKLDVEIEKEQAKIDAYDDRLKNLHNEVCAKRRTKEEKNRVIPLD